MALRRAAGDVPVAIVMGKAEVSRRQAEDLLRQSNGHVRRAIAEAIRS
jgi:N-acetylmuramic acid 6-phosphate (MurNAc-6-P) etherase